MGIFIIYQKYKNIYLHVTKKLRAAKVADFHKSFNLTLNQYEIFTMTGFVIETSEMYAINIYQASTLFAKHGHMIS